MDFTTQVCSHNQIFTNFVKCGSKLDDKCLLNKQFIYLQTYPVDVSDYCNMHYNESLLEYTYLDDKFFKVTIRP